MRILCVEAESYGRALSAAAASNRSEAAVVVHSNTVIRARVDFGSVLHSTNPSPAELDGNSKLVGHATAAELHLVPSQQPPNPIL